MNQTVQSLEFEIILATIEEERHKRHKEMEKFKFEREVFRITMISALKDFRRNIEARVQRCLQIYRRR